MNTPNSHSVFSSLKWQILIWMLLIALTPLLIMAIQGYHCAKEAITSTESLHLQAMLEARKVRITAWLDRVAADLHFLESSPCVRGICGMTDGTDPADASESCSEVCNLLDDLKLGSLFYDVIGAFDSEWEPLIWSAGPGCCASGIAASLLGPDAWAAPIGYSPSQQLRSDLALQSGPIFSSSSLAPNGNLLIQAGISCKTMPGSKTAYLAANINVSEILDPILNDRTGLGDLGDAYLVTPTGCYPNKISDDQTLASWSGSLGRVVVGDGVPLVRSYIGHNDKAVLGTATLIPGVAWLLVVEVAESEAYAWLTVLRVRAIITGLITLLLVILLSGRAAVRLANPLKELAAVAGRIARGRASERVRPLASTEADEVARVFNHMLDELDASHRKLVQAAALAAVGELSASVVHEIRNPLSSIKINIQALQKKVADDATHSELAAIAFEQVSRVERMLNELLAFGKPIDLNPKPLKLGDLIEAALAVAGPAASNKDISIDTGPADSAFTIVADSEQLGRALGNLIINSIQATSAGGKITIETAVESDPGRRLCIVVRDTGTGIPPVHADSIFQPFFTTHENGTGLGLAIVKKIVECHGGSVGAVNLEQGGAEFKIYLPRGEISQ